VRLPRTFGLRGRLVAAMIAVSILTLAVATAALLVPLDNRLRASALDALGQTALAARPDFADTPEGGVRVHSPSLTRKVERLRRQTGAEVLAVDPRGRILAATDADPGEQFPEAPEAIRAGVPVRRVIALEDGPEGTVAVPVTVEGKQFAFVLRRPLAAALSVRGVVERGLLLGAGAGLLLAAVAGVVLARRLVRRLNALRDAALRAAERGPGEVHTDRTRDEVGDLTRALATMQLQLQRQEQARRTFVATASHELRTPVSSLRLMLSMLEEDLAVADPDLADARDQVARANAQSARLGALAADLLDLSRLDAGLALRAERIRLDETARAVLAEFAARAPDVLRLEADEPLWATADPGSVAQVLRILVDNALRFAPAGEPIELTVGVTEDMTTAIVQDRGPGVPAPERERIFERFWRGSAGAGDGGFGLGLAIGRELARRMAGDLRLEDSPSGARFVLTLPPGDAAPAPHNLIPT
jgi:signal transduction histidine kinase